MQEIPFEFKGIAPRYDKKLPEGYAEEAENCMVYHGKLSPIAKNTKVADEAHHYNSFAYHCLDWLYQNNAFYCPWKIGVLDLLLYKDTSNYLKKKVAWIITRADISFDAASKEIRSANGDFYPDALIEGATFVVSGSANNDGTKTVSSTATTSGVITIDEAVVNESAGASVTIKVCKEDYLGQTRQNVPTIAAGDLPATAEGYWEQVAPQCGSETETHSLTVFNGKIYAGTYPHAKLFEWNAEDAWIERAPRVGAETHTHCLCVFNEKLYAGTAPNGTLQEWDGISNWTQKAPQLGAETTILCLAVFNDKLYAGTYPNGNLFEWNGTDAWVQKAPQYGAETGIHTLTVFNDKLYGTGYSTGKLYEWNGVNAWVEKAPALGAETDITSAVVFDEDLYGGTYPNAKLYKWNGVDAWTEVAPQAGSEIYIHTLVVLNEKIYAGTAEHAKLYEWNGVDGWNLRADQLEEETYIDSLVVLSGKIYGSTTPHGNLYEWIVDDTAAERQYFITTVRNIGGHIDESGPSTVSDAVNVVEDQLVTITKAAWVGRGTDAFVTHWNIYRLSNETGAWQLVAEVDWDTDSYVDDVADEDLGDTCPSYYTSENDNVIIWDEPLKNLDGITTHPISGIVFAWKGSQLFWLEPGYPDAWPDFYNLNFPATIKNCIPRDPALAVLTSIGPFRVDGNNPEALQQSDVCGPNPAMSILGCCLTEQFGGGVLYLSDSGIALFDMSSSKIITDDDFGEKWFKANVSPTGAVMIEVDNIIYLFHSGGGLMLDMRSTPRINTTLSEVIYGAYRKEDDDDLYVMDGVGIQKFGEATAGTKAMTWKSGELMGKTLDNKHFIDVKLKSNSGVSVAVTTYVDGTQSSTATLAMTTEPNKVQGFLNEKDYGRAAQVKIYKAADATLTPPGLEISEAIVRYTR